MLQRKKTNFHKSVVEISKSQFSFDKSIFDNFFLTRVRVFPLEKKNQKHILSIMNIVTKICLLSAVLLWFNTIEVYKACQSFMKEKCWGFFYKHPHVSWPTLSDNCQITALNA